MQSLSLHSDERRAEPRVPFGCAVQIGPPGGTPRAWVRARDLNSEGVFIEASRPVSEGVRFSVSVELPSGQRLYVDAAEVAYNVDTEARRGFGARFVELSPAVRAVLRAWAARGPAADAPRDTEIEATPHLSVVDDETEADRLAVSERDLARANAPLVLPAAESAPDSGGEPGAASASNWPTRPGHKLSEAWADAWEGEVEMKTQWEQDPWWERFKDWLSFDWVWLGMFAVGVVMVVLVVRLQFWSEPTAELEAVDSDPIALNADTHQALVSPVLPESSAAPVAAGNKNPGAAPKVEAPPSADTVPPKAPAAEPPPARLSPAARAALNTPTAGPARFQIAVGDGAHLVRSFALKAPARFVVDVRSTVALPAVAAISPVRAVRVGRHEGYSRLVFDVDAATTEGHAELRGDQLLVRIDR